MRIEKEYLIKDIKATLFYWNNKYLLKFERGHLEQTYKFSEFDFSKKEIEILLEDKFIEKVKTTFILMHENLQNSFQ